MNHIFTKNFARHWASIPFVWIMLVPVILVHITIELYHQVCFRLYGIELVNYKAYFNFDRRKLNYLSSLDKLNCGYCTYVNGTFAYVSEIGRRTEYYWCSIKHNNQPDNPAFAYQEKFAPYGDKEAFESIRSNRSKK